MSTFKKVCEIEDLLTSGVVVSDPTAHTRLDGVIANQGHPAVNAQRSSTGGTYLDSEPKTGHMTFSANLGRTMLCSGLDAATPFAAKFLEYDHARDTGFRLAINSTSLTDTYVGVTGGFLVRISGIDANGDAKGLWVRVEGQTEVIITENEDGTGGDVLWWAINSALVLPSAPVGFGPQPAVNVGLIHIGIPTVDGGTWAANIAANGTLWHGIGAGDGLSASMFRMQANGGQLFIKNVFAIGDNDSNNLTDVQLHRNNAFGDIDYRLIEFQMLGQVSLDTSSIPFLTAGDVLWVSVGSGGNSDHQIAALMNCWEVAL